MVDDTILKIVGTWNPLVPSNKPIVLESRITQVSKSHGGKKFCLRIVAKNSQGLYCTAPVFTTPICVKSKPRPEKRTRADDRKRDLQQLAAQAIDLIRRYQWIPVGYETNAADNARNDLNRPILECPECKVCYRASSSDPPPHAASCKFRALLEDAGRHQLFQSFRKVILNRCTRTWRYATALGSTARRQDCETS